MALSPLVGREEELALLLRRWEQAKSGSGKVVLISGEPGIGKSRLPAPCRTRLRGNRISSCASSARRIIRTARFIRTSRKWNMRPGFAREDTDEAKLSKLDAVLAQSDASDETAALIAELLSIETDQRERCRR